MAPIASVASEDGIRRVVNRVQMLWGASFGFYLFVFGPWFFESFGGLYDGQDSLTNQQASSYCLSLLAVRQVVIAILEVPAGALADMLGRSRFAILGFLLRALFFVGLAALQWAHADARFLVAVATCVVFSLSYVCYSGVLSAWVGSMCGRLSIPQMRSPIIANGYVWMFGAELVTGLFSVLTYKLGQPALTFASGILVCLIGSLYVFRFMNTGDVVTPRRSLFADLWKKCVLAAKVLSGLYGVALLVLLFASMMLLTNIVEYLWPVIIGVVDRSGWGWMGILMALAAVRLWGAGVVGRMLRKEAQLSSHQQAQRLRRVFATTSSAAAVGVIALAILAYYGYANVWLLGGVVLLVVLAHGAGEPAFQALVTYHTPPEYDDSRTTIMSLGSFVRSILVVPVVAASVKTAVVTSPIGWAAPAIIVLLLAIPVGAASGLFGKPTSMT